ncbi:peroxisomal assembly protein [Ceratobasidium sp. 414]|nr:peroxisomal assembly protein [Ceratobasidium sp. 414]
MSRVEVLLDNSDGDEHDLFVALDVWKALGGGDEERIGTVVQGQVLWARAKESLEHGTCVLPANATVGGERMSIVRTTPVPLSTVFVDSSAYTQDQERYYSHILRPNYLSVLATEPVLQGHAVRDYTKFILVPTPDSELAPDPEHSETSSCTETGSSELDLESESDALEIDEDFLRGWDPDSRVPFPLTPRPTDTVEGQNVHVGTVDLAKLGMLSGHWAVISPGEAHPDRARLVKVHAQDHIHPSTVIASPLLLHNTLPPSTQSQLYLRPTPFTSRLPPTPLAKSLTFARVASRAANDRRLAPRVVRALRELLERSPLLLKLHDLVAVYVDVSEPDEDDDEGEGEGEGDANKASGSNVDIPLGDVHPRLGLGIGGSGVGISGSNQDTEHTTPIFLKVVHIEHTPPTTLNGTSDDPSGTYDATTLGELGCTVDPRTTRVAMVGIEHSVVPCLESVDEDEEGDESVESLNYGIALSALVRGPRGAGKARAVQRAAARVGVGIWEINAYTLLADTDAKTEGAVRARFEQAATCAPCVFLLRHIEALVRPGQGGRGKDAEPAMASVLAECIRSLGAAWGATGYPVAVVATTAEPDAIPVSVMACFRHELVVEAPDERRRAQILEGIVRAQKLPLAPDVELGGVARETAALHAGDLVNLVRSARDEALKRVLRELAELEEKQKHQPPEDRLPLPDSRDLALATIPLTARDLESALDAARAAYSESIGAPKIPNVSWDDVGGLAHVKSDILDTIQLPLEHPELFADGMKKRSGILLYGPPGTGKTLLAKAVATSCALNFLSVKGPELLNMYIGESEANVRRVFQRARDARPCVVFFDELDSVAPRRGQAGDSGGVMDRIVSQLLAELDGMGAGGGGGEVFVIGATNRPDLLDPALLRPGRFDRMLYLGVSTTHADQLRIIQALTRKFRLDPSLDLAAVAERCPFNFTGADFYALCSDAMLKAMARKAEEVERRVAEINAQPPLPEHTYPMTAQYYLAELATAAETDVLVNADDFFKALDELVPSVSASELEHYREVQQKFASSTINSVEKEEHEPIKVDGEEPISKQDKGKGKVV